MAEPHEDEPGTRPEAGADSASDEAERGPIGLIDGRLAPVFRAPSPGPGAA